jgi:hypothetical protein
LINKIILASKLFSGIIKNMNKFDGKSYFIDNPLEFQRTSIAGPNGTSFPRASISYYDEKFKKIFVKSFPPSIANNILELYNQSGHQGEFKITKTGQGKQSRYEVTQLKKTEKAQVITPKTIINAIMELDVNK